MYQVILLLILLAAQLPAEAGTRHYRNAAGDYLGGYGDGAAPPANAIEVTAPPAFGTDLWNGSGWTPRNRPPDWPAFADALEDDPAVPMQLHQYLRLIERNAHRPARCKALWAKLKAAGLPWLNASAITAIETHAANNNIPLK